MTAYKGFRQAGGRFSEGIRPGLDRHRSELIVEKLTAVHAFDKAHAVMLVEESLIDAEIGRQILTGLLTMEEQGVVESRLAADGGLHSGEHFLTDMYGPQVGGRIHLGRSSADLAGVGRRMVTRDRLLAVLTGLNEVRLSIAEAVPSSVNVLMPAYTYGQQAQPTTYAHWLSMWSAVLARDFVRLSAAFGAINRSPAGAAAVTGSDFDLNRDRTAELLGFDRILVNTMDATLSNDSFVETVSAMCVLAGNLGRLAEDLLFWSTVEVGFVTIPERFCDTSSIMAQKRNPYVLHELRALAVQAEAALIATVGAEAGATGQAVLARKVAEDAAWSLFSKMLLRLDDLSDLMASVILHPDRMAQSTEDNWSQATDLAGLLVREAGFSWRDAHQAVGTLVRTCEARGVRPAEVTLESINEATAERGLAPVALSPAALRSALSARGCVERRTGPGGPAPARVISDLTSITVQLEKDDARLDELRQRLTAGAATLETAVRTIIDGDVPVGSRHED